MMNLILKNNLQLEKAINNQIFMIKSNFYLLKREFRRNKLLLNLIMIQVLLQKIYSVIFVKEILLERVFIIKICSKIKMLHWIKSKIKKMIIINIRAIRDRHLTQIISLCLPHWLNNKIFNQIILMSKRKMNLKKKKLCSLY
jgi:hypothetical protein